MLKLRKWKSILLLMSLTLILTACNGGEEDEGQASSGNGSTISISGSTSVGPLAEKLAAKYMESANVNIEINQIGSSAGITNAINGVSDIGMSSRSLESGEEEEVSPTIIAFDGIVVVTHANNKVKDLTMDEVKKIFTGEITNWKEVGGKDMEIVVVSREDGSGSRDAFQEIVDYSSGELVRNSIIASGNGNIKTTVATNEHAIGFISFEYIDETISTVHINGVEPTAKNVIEGKYPLSRPFLFVHKDLSEESQAFIDFILSEAGQEIAAEAGAIPITEE
ncbi:phosphate ABC transporter substrate-binding protein [Cytobacillus sp. Sa5YUA1]|uniref:Phosphate-binding protein n=1 Tax=Cytobacillus stercorigallinarum TaxID=2762240 RepID=A0ABR8QQS1_9BACI|nr:phosphate ABC transporter substrate-binding protein [Cytobacillus stercorigallinarum]MBD7937870.1 phosphate ABC transporter substrate-binding protein [Cytobacillus stercorigallinarum]